MDVEVQYAVLNTLSYFQVFEYPLTRADIRKYLSVECTPEVLEAALSRLTKLKVIYCIDQYFCLKNDIRLVYRRKQINKIAEKKLKSALLIGRFLGLFPFVESVCVSGPISRGYAFKHSELTFFIITAPNRLWIARKMLLLFRKVAHIVNAQKLLGATYFMSRQRLELTEKNEMNAIELASLLPATVHNGWGEFKVVNTEWLLHYLPNSVVNTAPHPKSQRTLFTKVLESIINKIGGDKMEDRICKKTINRSLGKSTLIADRNFISELNDVDRSKENISEIHGRILNEARIKLFSANYGSLSTICYN
jgi:hypothetical protein